MLSRDKEILIVYFEIESNYLQLLFLFKNYVKIKGSSTDTGGIIMWTKFRHRVFHRLFRPLVNLTMRLKNNFRGKVNRLPKVPHLILFNHPSNFDPVYVGASFNRPTYFIATDDIFNIPFTSKLISYLVAPIPTKKGTRDSSTIRTAIQVIKEGGNVGFSPEGNRNYSGGLNYIDPSTIKFIKLLKVPVVLYTIKGGFGANPRFATETRKGLVTGNVAKIISKEEIASLNNSELYEIVTTTLDVDDTLLKLPYKGNNLAEHLESMIYVCPICNELHSIYSAKDELGCNNCNFTATYTEKLLFKSEDKRVNFNKVLDIYCYQENFIRNYDFRSLSYLDKDVSISLMSRTKRRDKLESGTLIMDQNKIMIQNDEKTFVIYLEYITSLTISYHNTLVINIDNNSYYLKGNDKFNALKYVHLFTIIKNNKRGNNNEFLGI